MSLGVGSIYFWDFCAGHCGKAIYSHLLVLFCPEEPRLAAPDALPFKYPRFQMPQQTQMSVRPRTCRTVSAPRARAGQGGFSIIPALAPHGVCALRHSKSSSFLARGHPCLVALAPSSPPPPPFAAWSAASQRFIPRNG